MKEFDRGDTERVQLGGSLCLLCGSQYNKN